MPELELDDIQGIILSGYGKLVYSAYLFLRFNDSSGARRWLGRLAPQITTSRRERDKEGKVIRPTSATNLALTAPGLKALGLDPGALATFPQEFVEGMAHDPRPRRMGDTGASAPERWEFGGAPDPELRTDPRTTNRTATTAGMATSGGHVTPRATSDYIHALLIFQTGEAPDDRKGAFIDKLCADCAAEFPDFGIEEVVERHVACQSPDAKEPFGFRDAISQPHVEGSPAPNRSGGRSIKAGEFVLGYDNEYGVPPQSPVVPAVHDRGDHLRPHPEKDPALGEVKDLGRNGSFLVFRKLAQDVAAFRRFLRDNSPDDEHERAALGAKLVGRWPGGAPLALCPGRDDPDFKQANDFGYADLDPHGFRCPMGAHVRRSNPRDALIGGKDESLRSVNRHRILRRGVVYGDPLPQGVFEDDGRERGILFVCVNADIERQFEFIQQTWINSPKFGGAYTDPDPITGPGPDDGAPATFTIPGEPSRRRLRGLARFVTVRGGGYFFLPSVRALRFLAEM